MALANLFELRARYLPVKPIAAKAIPATITPDDILDVLSGKQLTCELHIESTILPSVCQSITFVRAVSENNTSSGHFVFREGVRTPTRKNSIILGPEQGLLNCLGISVV
jgi:hypothetical protein